MISLGLETLGGFLIDYALDGILIMLLDRFFLASLDSSVIHIDLSSKLILLSYHCNYVFKWFCVVDT